MRQVVQDPSTGRVEVVEVPDPTVGSDEVLVRNAWSLISPGTDEARSRLAKKSLLGKARERPDDARQVLDKAVRDGPVSALRAVRARLDDPLTPGYSTAGVVEAVGRHVDGITVGQEVACVGADVACHAERITVPPALCIPLPTGLDTRWGAWAALGGVAGHAVRLSGVEAGSTVLVVGLGLVGQLVVQLVTAAGGRCVAVDRLQERVALAEDLGARAGTTDDDAAVELVLEISAGDGADAVIIAAATRDHGPLELGARAARDRATITVVGDAGMAVPRREFYAKELNLRVSRSYGPGRYDPSYELEGREYPIGYVRWTQRRIMRHFLEQVADGDVNLAPLVTHEFPIRRAEEAYAILSDAARLGILLRYPPSPQAAADRVGVPASPVVKSIAGNHRPTVAFLGPGMFGRTMLLPLLRKMDVDLVSVSGGSSVRSFAAARRWGGREVVADPREAARDPAVDVVVIATRHDSHADLASCALESGKGVFLEKPLAIDTDGLEKVRAALPAGRLVVDFNRSLAPATANVRQYFDGRQEPLVVECRVNAGFLPPDHWVRDPAVGGGRVVGEGCHFVDLCSTIVGYPLISVAAASLSAAGKTLAGDSFVLTLRYEDGSVATLSYASNGPRRLRKERVEVIGAGRAAVIDDFRGVVLYSSARTRRLRSLGQDKGHRVLLESAFRYFVGSPDPPIPHERLFETTRATFAAREAIQRRVTSELALSEQ